MQWEKIFQFHYDTDNTVIYAEYNNKKLFTYKIISKSRNLYLQPDSLMVNLTLHSITIIKTLVIIQSIHCQLSRNCSSYLLLGWKSFYCLSTVEIPNHILVKMQKRMYYGFTLSLSKPNRWLQIKLWLMTMLLIIWPYITKMSKLH